MNRLSTQHDRLKEHTDIARLSRLMQLEDTPHPPCHQGLKGTGYWNSLGLEEVPTSVNCHSQCSTALLGSEQERSTSTSLCYSPHTSCLYVSHWPNPIRSQQQHCLGDVTHRDQRPRAQDREVWRMGQGGQMEHCQHTCPFSFLPSFLPSFNEKEKFHNFI